ncbi:phosphoglycerate mutase protein [Apiospora kogelbergensis]|uniref:phosphoglycerate mutase protein n=1 Tax=Apiospora kogelbergensis TaxID=1337665 RepID=UPI00312EDC1C
MPATIWLIRHAEGLHNKLQNSALRDPMLTDEGTRQAEAFWRETGSLYAGNIAAIFASPSIRAIQTAQLGLQGIVQQKGQPGAVQQQGLPIILQPDMMEMLDPGSLASGSPQVTSSIPRENWALNQRFGRTLSFELVPSADVVEWSDRNPNSIYADTPAAYTARAGRARETLRQAAEALPDDQIVVVVAHYESLRWLVGGDNGQARVTWRNCEMRPYRFEADPFSRARRYYLRPATAPNQPAAAELLSLRHVVTGRLSPEEQRRADLGRVFMTWGRSQELAQEFSTEAGRAFDEGATTTTGDTDADAPAMMTMMTPRFRFRRDLIHDPVTRMRARQLRRYVEIYPADHGSPPAVLEQALVVAPGDAWTIVSPLETLWPDEWHPTNPDMAAQRSGFLLGWSRVFPGNWNLA